MLAVAIAAGAACLQGRAAPARLRVLMSVPSSQATAPLDGRMLLILSTDERTEPRFQVSDNDRTAQIFGVDVEGLKPGEDAVVDADVLGYPATSLADIKPGDYSVQALLHVYETFKRSDGHTVKLPPDRGEGQQWSSAPGNVYSAPVKVRIDPSSERVLHIALDKKIPPLPDLPDTKYVKRIRIQSERLTKFWGRPTYLGALVVLPEGWERHPNVRYPLAINHGHFQREVSGWRETPPDPKLPPADVANIAKFCPNGHEGEPCTKYGYERMQQEYGYAFFKQWTGPKFPRVIMVTIQHANPYYDDSYAVNSENLGPYGDAITYELIPYIEQTFRGIGPWARAVYGGSTGGWEALGVQVFYPDLYNGAWANCPDPIDFRAYTVVNVYEDQNAYYSEGPFKRTPRPGQRDYLGQTRSTVEQDNLMELVLGTKSRSGGQWDIWEAVFSPVGADGYPKRIWDKRTGAIDKDVAEYWREHYDLVHIMRRDWATLGPKLRGKITLNVGLSDNFFLNNAVYLADEFLKSANPPADARIDYGMKDEHCWSGDHEHVNAISRLTYNGRFIPLMAERWQKTAPTGADTKGWRY
jgi:putative esterase